ncbi:MAG: class I SAM-dependent methyltransferase, partial [Solirubrobacteraceae bacterium]|nr:class I SAM-dependent methyltransferase [Solirubrobacteraceae bacterium]
PQGVEKEKYFKENNPYCRKLYETVITFKAKTILELGVGEAFSTVSLLAAVKETDGVLWSIDKRIFVPGIERIQRTSFIDIQRWHFILSNDLEYSKNWNLTVDILYVDTNHRYEQTLKELELYSPYVKKGGAILMHDTLLSGEWDGAPARVKDAIDTFLISNPKWKFTELLPNDEGNCGLGILMEEQNE